MENGIKTIVAVTTLCVGLLQSAPAGWAAEVACVERLGSGPEVTCGQNANSVHLTVEMDQQFSSLPPTAQEELLQVRVQRGQEKATVDALRFYTAYGEFKACLLCIVPDKAPYVVLTTSYGHGTNVRRKRLTIYSAEGESIEPVFTAPIFGFFGYGSWSYEARFADLNGDGILDLRMVLQHDRVEDSQANEPSLLPRAQVLEYLFNPRRNSFEPSSVQQ